MAQRQETHIEELRTLVSSLDPRAVEAMLLQAKEEDRIAREMTAGGNRGGRGGGGDGGGESGTLSGERGDVEVASSMPSMSFLFAEFRRMLQDTQQHANLTARSQGGRGAGRGASRGAGREEDRDANRSNNTRPTTVNDRHNDEMEEGDDAASSIDSVDSVDFDGDAPPSDHRSPAGDRPPQNAASNEAYAAEYQTLQVRPHHLTTSSASLSLCCLFRPDPTGHTLMNS